MAYETNGSNVTSYTLAGSKLISQTRNGATSYFLQDGQGSTRTLTNSAGNVTDTYDYTAFGELRNQTGTTENKYLYTGQQFDRSTGLYNLRARFYSPSVGRFLSQDTFAVNFGNPIELNRYGYAAGNPINFSDPSGYESEDYGLRVATIIGTLTAGYQTIGPMLYYYYGSLSLILTYLPRLLSLPTDQLIDLLSVGQFGYQSAVSLWTNATSSLMSGGGDSGIGGGGDGNEGNGNGDGGWDDPYIPEPGEIINGRNKGEPQNGERGIYEYIDQDTGEWYVGSAYDQSLRDRLQNRVTNRVIKSWNDVVWTEIKGNPGSPRAIQIAERIRIEQVSEMVGGRGNMSNNPLSNPASQKAVINWFADGWPQRIPGWPAWLTNPWP